MARIRGGLTITDLFLLACGALLYTIASPPYEWTGAAWFALSPLFLVIRHTTPVGAFLAGLLYGVLACCGTASWVYYAVAIYFSLPFPFDVLFTLAAYAFFVGSYMGLAAGLACLLMRRNTSVGCWLGVPALWVGGEFARSSLFSGFSWWLIGYTQYRHLPLIQISDITGVYGLSFLIALNSFVTAELLRFLYQRWQERTPQTPLTHRDRPPWLALGTVIASVAAALLYGSVRLSFTPPVSQSPVTVAMVQGDVPSEQRWQRAHYASTLQTYASLTRQGVKNSRPQLIVWPEFALGFYLEREYLLRARLAQLTRQLNTFLLVGAPRIEETQTDDQYYNAAYFLSPQGQVLDVYDKMRLLPFAEYRPLALPALLTHSSEHPSYFTPGQRPTVFSLPQAPFGVFICYEATYPHLVRRFVQHGAQFLVNISNDTWLVQGGQAAAAQHFAMAVFRAVENRRPLARVATAGISGFVDAYGRRSHVSAAAEGVIQGQVLPQHDMTLYTRYGDWFAWGCIGWALVALFQVRQTAVSTRWQS